MHSKRYGRDKKAFKGCLDQYDDMHGDVIL